MVNKKEIIGNEMIKEIITIRTDTLWRMLGFKKEGRLPRVNDEGATGKFDNKGALFIPGGLVYEDVDEMPIRYKTIHPFTAEGFRKKIREAMQYDNATLIHQNGIAAGVNLNNGFFSKAARQILTNKRAALRRRKFFSGKLPTEIYSNDITRSYIPTYMKEPYGARTRLSSCLTVAFTDPPMYFAHCKTDFRLKKQQHEVLCSNMDMMQKPVVDGDKTVLAPPYIVVCHCTRYKEKVLTGITRILGFGKFGEFANFTLEEVSSELLREISGPATDTNPSGEKKEFTQDEIFAEYDDVKVVGVLRIYSPTSIGKRSLRITSHLVLPVKDLGLDLKEIETQARKRYGIN